MKYEGRMGTALLNDRQIRPTEYRKWDDAVRRFARRDKDLAIVADLVATIPTQGLRKPIVLGVSDRFPDVYVGDGHHRAVALMQLGVLEFPFHWYWIGWSSVRMEEGPFPYHLLSLPVPAVAAAPAKDRW